MSSASCHPAGWQAPKAARYVQQARHAGLMACDLLGDTPASTCVRPACSAPCALQEELEQWATATRQKAEDSLALERYRRQDEARVKELGMQLERAAREAHQGRQDLEEELTATQVGGGDGGSGAWASRAQRQGTRGQVHDTGRLLP